MTRPLHAGVARRDITPPLGTPLMGYPNPGRTATSVRDGLNVTALALEQDGRCGAILSFDLCVPDDDTVARLRAGIAERTGVPEPHVTISYTQTHSGPNTQTAWGWCDRDDAFIDTMIPRAIDAAAEAIAGLKPVRVGIGTARSGVGINRRAIREDHSVGLGTNPWGPYDPTMTVLRFEAAPGHALATLVHYGAHPTVFDGATRAVSRDWPGVMIDRVEHFSQAPAVFINGAVGDVAPRSNTMSAVGDGETALQEVGTRAAMDAMRAFREVKEFRELELGFFAKPFTMPYRPLASLAEAQQKVAEFAPRKDTFGAPRCEYLHWSAVVREHEKRDAPDGKRFEQTITTLGPVALVPFPGEVFSETVLRLRQASPYPHTLCASTTNGSNGYFPTRESLHRGGYEVWVAKAFGARIFSENLDDVLFEENLKLLREAWEKTNAR